MSFRLKTVLGIALIEGVLLLVLVYTSIDYLKSSNEAEIQRRASSIISLFAAATKDAVISTDLSTLEELTQELLSKDHVRYVRVYDQQNLLIDERAAGVSEADYPHLLPISQPIEVAGFAFGRVEVGLDTTDYELLVSSATRQFLSIAGLEMLLVALFSWLLGIYLTRNLDSLKLASERILGGETGVQVQVNSDDELGQTAKAFNRMLDKVESNRQELEQANIQLSTILESAVDGFIIFNVEGEIVEVNPAIVSLFGYEAQALIGQPIANLVPLNYREQYHQQLMQFIASNRGRLSHKQRELLALRANGERFPVDMAISKMIINNQTMLLGLVKDLTEIKRKEARIRRSEAILLATLEASPDALITIDIAGKIQAFNDAASSLFGYGRKQAIGAQMADLLFVDSQHERFSRCLQTFRQTGAGPGIKSNITLHARKQDGEALPVELKLVPVQMGDEILLTAFLHDISRRLAYERELQSAKEQAEAGSQAKSRFLATMSHEIRSPLNAVLGSVDLILGSSLDEEQRLYAQTAKEAGTALLSTINDILDFSKIEAGEIGVELETFSVQKLLELVINILQPKAREKGIAFACFINRNVPDEVEGDLQHLRQVLQNLVDNAIKFSHRGYITLEAWVPDAAQSDASLCFSVADQGIGISQSAQRKLFKEFSQVHDQRNTQYGGTGLGLAISAQLVRLMGGELTLESLPEQGSCFKFDVRVKLNSQGAAMPRHLPAHARVLLLHPDSHFHRVLSKQYSQYGVSCVCVDSPEQLFQPHLVKGRFNLILLDEFCLHSLNQADCQRLSQGHLTEQGRLLALMDSLVASIDSQLSELRPNLTELGISGHVTKPLMRQQMLQLLQDGAAPAQDTARPSEQLTASSQSQLPILMAEDSKSNQLIGGAMLTKAGYRVEFANNGVEAVECVAKHDYGLVLMDMRMPEMDGLEATRRILASHPHTIILAMTANVQKEDIEDCFDAGMQDFIAKPVNRAELLQKVAYWLDKASRQAPENSTERDNHREPDNEKYGESYDETYEDSYEDRSEDRCERRLETQAVNSLADQDRLLDSQVIAELTQTLGQASLDNMYGVYLKETESRLSCLRELPINGDDKLDEDSFEQLETQAHTLKSSSGSFGASALAEVAKALEQSAQRRDRAQVETLLSELFTVAELTMAAIAAKITHNREEAVRRVADA
ncbi:PAS domain S-box protein [Shewanella alkalitolerans]|nr:PAS domain S-box protein [Shewanella alkalitolerans]